MRDARSNDNTQTRRSDPPATDQPTKLVRATSDGSQTATLDTDSISRRSPMNRSPLLLPLPLLPLSHTHSPLAPAPSPITSPRQINIHLLRVQVQLRRQHLLPRHKHKRREPPPVLLPVRAVCLVAVVPVRVRGERRGRLGVPIVRAEAVHVHPVPRPRDRRPQRQLRAHLRAAAVGVGDHRPHLAARDAVAADVDVLRVLGRPAAPADRGAAAGGLQRGRGARQGPRHELEHVGAGAVQQLAGGEEAVVAVVAGEEDGAAAAGAVELGGAHADVGVAGDIDWFWWGWDWLGLGLVGVGWGWVGWVQGPQLQEAARLVVCALFASTARRCLQLEIIRCCYQRCSPPSNRTCGTSRNMRRQEQPCFCVSTLCS